MHQDINYRLFHNLTGNNKLILKDKNAIKYVMKLYFLTQARSLVNDSKNFVRKTPIL